MKTCTRGRMIKDDNEKRGIKKQNELMKARRTMEGETWMPVCLSF